MEGLPSSSEKDKKTFWAHLEELRFRILFSLVSVTVIAAAVYFSSSDTLLSFLTKPLALMDEKVYFHSLYDAFVVKLQISFWSGLFLGMPMVLAQTWLFIAPGLYEKEKRIFLLFLLSSMAMFALGAALAFFLVIPAALKFFLAFSTPGLQPLLSINKYLSFVSWMALAFGLSFETPILIAGLLRFEVFRVEQIRAARPYVILAIFIFSAIVTPSTDPISQCLLAIPLWLLFEVGLLTGNFFRTR